MTVSMETKMTEATSLAQTQELLMTIFSCVGYLRDLFPEESFQDNKVAGMNLKKFKKGIDPNSDQLLKWIEEGCFDALNKKYLKTAVLTILADTSSPNNVLETYTLRVNYPDSPLHQSIDAATANIAQLSLTRNDKSIVSVDSSPSNFRESISKILRSLCVMSQTLKSLPIKKYLSMKLSYYEEVTPAGYEPPGFVAAEFDIDHLFQAPTSKYSFGKAGTAYHNIGLSMETICDDSIRPAKTVAPPVPASINSQALVFPESAIKPQNEEMYTDNINNNTIDVQEGMNFNESIMIASQVAQPTNSPPKFPVSQQSPPPFKPKEIKKEQISYNELSATQQQVQLIKCTCGCNVKDLEMLQCDSCLSWQHSVCSGYVSCRDRRLENSIYICYFCKYGRSPHTFQFIQQLSKMRKALAIISAEGFDHTTALASRMGLSWHATNKLKQRLIDEKFLIPMGSKKCEIAKKDEYIKERIKYYFNQNLQVHAEFNEAQAADSKTVSSGIKRKNEDNTIPFEVLSNTANDNDQITNNMPIIPETLNPVPKTSKPVAEKCNNPTSFVPESSNSTPFVPETYKPTSFVPETPNPVSFIPTPTSAKPVIKSEMPVSPPTTVKKNLNNKKRKISIPNSRISCYMNKELQ